MLPDIEGQWHRGAIVWNPEEVFEIVGFV